MLIRTHIAITICAILIFISSVEHKLIFVLIMLIATFIPDVDSKFSTLGKKKTFRVLQFFIKHRGIMHSFTFLLLITLLLTLFFPVLALGFFLGYGLHLFADSFTSEGIRPFYPFKKRVRGPVKTGGRFEIMFLVGFVILDLFLFFQRFF